MSHRQNNTENYGGANPSDDWSNAPAFAWGDVDTEDDNSPRPYRSRTPASAQNYGGETSYEANTPSGARPGIGYDQALTSQPQGWQRRSKSYHEMMALPPGAEDDNTGLQVSGSRSRYDNTYQQSSEQRSQADALAFAIPNTPGAQSQRSQSRTPHVNAIEGTPDRSPYRQALDFPPWPHYPGHGIPTTDGTELEVFVLCKLKDRILTTNQMSVWAAGTTNTIAGTWSNQVTGLRTPLTRQEQARYTWDGFRIYQFHWEKDGEDPTQTNRD